MKCRVGNIVNKNVICMVMEGTRLTVSILKYIEKLNHYVVGLERM